MLSHSVLFSQAVLASKKARSLEEEANKLHKAESDLRNAVKFLQETAVNQHRAAPGMQSCGISSVGEITAAGGSNEATQPGEPGVGGVVNPNWSQEDERYLEELVRKTRRS